MGRLCARLAALGLGLGSVYRVDDGLKRESVHAQALTMFEARARVGPVTETHIACTRTLPDDEEAEPPEAAYTARFGDIAAEQPDPEQEEQADEVQEAADDELMEAAEPHCL